MMEKIFLSVVNMSASASWLIIAILILRLFFRKIPRAYICVLWALVGLRLAMPFSIEAPFSLLPSAEVFPDEFLYAAAPEINSGIDFVDNSLNPVIEAGLAPSPGASANPTQINAAVFSQLWCFVAVLMLVYMAVSFIRIKLRVRESVLMRENIWLCDRVDTPFILGVIRPRIYLPSDIGENDAAYVVAHEKAHIKRLDFIWKPLGFLILAVHWFNPLVWLSYVLFCRDIEFACDERVVKGFSSEEKKEYSEVLLNLSVPKHMISACPLAFGEVGVKERIKSVLNYKKPAFWVVIVSIVLVIAMAVGFLTSPFLEKDTPIDMPIDKSEYSEEFKDFVDEQIKFKYSIATNNWPDSYYGFDWEIIGAKKKGTKTTIYAWVMVEKFVLRHSSYDSMGYGIARIDHTPTIIVVDEASEEYCLVEYWCATGSDNYEKDIKAKFPKELWADAFNPEKYEKRQSNRCFSVMH